MHPTEEKWYSEANQYKPQAARDYAWVLDYAKFRLQFTFDNARYLEGKALSLLQFDMAIATGVWAIFSFAVPKTSAIDIPTTIFIAVGLLFLLISGFFVLKAFGPSRRPVPLAEDVALRAIDTSETPSGGVANFSLILAASTDYQSELTSKKGQLLRRGVYMAYGALVMFSASLFWLAFLQRFPTWSPVVGR